ncbi:MAG: hypothetical protein FJ399_14135 [Verrucomicrobia bacterium]|nr:hypothetical protein [Verrucomicrobiota bacterium]
MNKSNYLRKKTIDHLLGVTPYVAPSEVDFALYTVAPTAAGGGTEVAGNGYARKRVATGGAVFPAASSTGVLTSGSSVDFVAAEGGAWGTIVAVGILDTLGNLLFFANLTTQKTINDGESLSFRTGDLVFTEQ